MQKKSCLLLDFKPKSHQTTRQTPSCESRPHGLIKLCCCFSFFSSFFLHPQVGHTGSKQSPAHNMCIHRGVLPSGVEDLHAVKPLADIGSSVLLCVGFVYEVYNTATAANVSWAIVPKTLISLHPESFSSCNKVGTYQTPSMWGLFRTQGQSISMFSVFGLMTFCLICSFSHRPGAFYSVFQASLHIYDPVSN